MDAKPSLLFSRRTKHSKHWSLTVFYHAQTCLTIAANDASKIAKALAESLQINSTLKTLNLGSTYHLRYPHSNYVQTAVSAPSQHWWMHSRLTRVSQSSTFVVRALTSFPIPIHTWIGNKLSSDAAKDVCAILEVNTTLKILHLGGILVADARVDRLSQQSWGCWCCSSGQLC